MSDISSQPIRRWLDRLSERLVRNRLNRNLTQGETEFEETEDLLIQKLPIDEAIERVLEGEITDAISVAGLLKLKCIL